MCKQLYVQLNLRRFIWFLSFQNEIVKLEWDKNMPGFGRIFGTWEFGRCLKAIQSQQYSRKICIDENFYFKSDLSPQVKLTIEQTQNNAKQIKIQTCSNTCSNLFID
ncbi:Hypothetical_protein [Hexamita inflata]|uniref:Hypothetical_protein n=1 Tax=Hexamita inflata TaxID=28002 RepID=A0AA86PDC6_9EUKA|nr:Hypothetical protein HINF_LOCUS21382 [Hexamita inflata]